ncbi:hypothetical protein SLEP1_g41972 [Rubroshorea leprosula]|uniref:Glyceraldehyde 3-phosphate dehydrogenase NAD(P) binding domain-containing protein n=1 Tax=Rubroshorea leprosula TaxID=152421 RepID=A0AAV5L8C9_9ROSI|nr:hypothetical protein SLEP1_g41972 [Rubroshorea leprosula]
MDLDTLAETSFGASMAGKTHPLMWLLLITAASHLLKYDSMLGTFKAEVKIVDDTTISVDGKPIKVVSNRGLLKLPWADLGIDIVIEVDPCTSSSSIAVL